MFQTQQCGGGGGGDPQALRSRPLETARRERGYEHSVEHRICASQEKDANALAKAIDPKMQLCPRMGNPENPTRASPQGLITRGKERV